MHVGLLDRKHRRKTQVLFMTACSVKRGDAIEISHYLHCKPALLKSRVSRTSQTDGSV